MRAFLVTSLLFLGCTRELELPSVLDFGSVERGSPASRTFTLTNTTGSPRSFSLSTDLEDFAVDPTSLTLQPSKQADVTVTFSPRQLGVREGTLSLGVETVRLRGRAQGPKLDAPTALNLPLAALVDGAGAVVSGELVVRNVGTSASRLTVSQVQTSGPGLCVGALVDGVCQPATLHAVAPFASLVLPVVLEVTDDTPHTWSVRFETNDPDQPVVEIPVRVSVERFAPCRWAGPAGHDLNDTRALVFTNTGSERCLVRELAVTGAPTGAVEVRGPSLPKALAPGEDLAVFLEQREFATQASLEVRAEGTAPFEVPLVVLECVRLEPSLIDFGTVRATCGASGRAVQLLNTCRHAVTLQGVQVDAPFFTSSQPPVTLAPLTSGTFIVDFRPQTVGAVSSALRVTTNWGEFVLGVQGVGDARPEQRDVFRDDPPALGDVLVLIDASPSFVSKRAAVRDNLENLLRGFASPCFDQRWAFAPADRGAGVELLRSDAGAQWTSTADPNFVAQLLSAFDALPVLSEDEACVEPAVNLLTDAGVRSQGVLSALCITDAPEAPGAFARFNDLQALRGPSNTRWSVVTGLAISTCAIEAPDDGTHAALVNRSSGRLDDICYPNWFTAFGPPTHQLCGRTRYFLSSLPSGPITVIVNGTTLPATAWEYDAATNSVFFQPFIAPAPGSTIEFVYRSAC